MQCFFFSSPVFPLNEYDFIQTQRLSDQEMEPPQQNNKCIEPGSQNKIKKLAFPEFIFDPPCKDIIKQNLHMRAMLHIMRL